MSWKNIPNFKIIFFFKSYQTQISFRNKTRTLKQQFIVVNFWDEDTQESYDGLCSGFDMGLRGQEIPKSNIIR